MIQSRERQVLRSPITRRLTQIMPAHIAADGIDLVGSSVLPTHFEPMVFWVTSKTSNHYDIANATDTKGRRFRHPAQSDG